MLLQLLRSSLFGFCFLVIVDFSAITLRAMCENSFGAEPKALNANVDFSGPYLPHLNRTYFVFTRRFGDRTLRSITRSLDSFKKMGVTELWISPVHPQTTHTFRGTPNDHGYWWENPAAIAEELGGDEAFDELMTQSRARGIRVMLDMVLDQAGYADYIWMDYKKENGEHVRKKLSTLDTRYFRANYDPVRLARVYDAIELAQNRSEVLTSLRELAILQWDKDLPVFNHNNPEIYDWLYFSYRSYIDRGVRSFRLDAFKHIPIDFLLRIVSDLNHYSKEKYGESLVFLAEFLLNSKNYAPLREVSRYFHEQAPDVRLYFIDFPKAHEIRRFEYDQSFGLQHFAGFINHREDPNTQLPLGLLVSDIENHDFLKPVQDPFVRQMVFVLADFFSSVPTIMFHGGERLDRSSNSRSQINEIEEDGVIGLLSRELNEALAPFRDSPEFGRTQFHIAEHDHLIASKLVRDHVFVLIVNRENRSMSYEIPIRCGSSTKPAKIEQIVSSIETPETSVELGANGKWNIHTAGRTVTVVRARACN